MNYDISVQDTLANADAEIAQFSQQIGNLLAQRQVVVAQLGDKLFDITKSDPAIRAKCPDLYDAVDAVDHQIAHAEAQIDLINAKREEAIRAQEEAQWEAAAKLAAEEAARAASIAEEQARQLEAIRSARQEASARSNKASETFEVTQTAVKRDVDKGISITTAMTCPGCGSPITAADQFCGSCGYQLR